MAVDEPWRDDVRAAVAGCTRITLDDALAHVRAAIANGASAAHASDLALAFGASRGDPAVAKRFDRHVEADLVAAARAIDRDATFVDEVCQLTRVRLGVAEAGGAPRLASYRGTGSLRAWVAIAARRIALNKKRDTRPADHDLLADLVDREPDPEMRHLRTLYRAELQEVLVGALGELTDRARAVLRLRFVDGLELAEIGRLYRVHESTASRWISAALEQVGRTTRERLIERLSITAATAESVARMVQSGLDLSVARLLG